MKRLLFFCVMLLSGVIPPAFADGRVALVIGNAKYMNVSKLVNPTNDANAIAAMLKEAGFDDVDLAFDLSLTDFRHKLSDFELRALKSETALIYYSGHGLEIGGQNYLVPVDATLSRDIDVDDETVSLDRVLKAVSGASRLKLVILDACRNNPFVSAMHREVPTRAVGERGLARIEPETPNTLVAYAAKAGTFARDGDGLHSPFTTALLHYLPEPNLDVRLALGHVRDDVLASTKDSPSPQEPFVYGSLGGAELPLVKRAPAATPKSTSPDDIAWDLVRDSTTMGPLFRFIDQYPTSSHRSEALQRASLLEQPSPSPAAVTAPVNTYRPMPKATPLAPLPAPPPQATTPPAPTRPIAHESAPRQTLRRAVTVLSKRNYSPKPRVVVDAPRPVHRHTAAPTDAGAGESVRPTSDAGAGGAAEVDWRQRWYDGKIDSF